MKKVICTVLALLIVLTAPVLAVNEMTEVTAAPVEATVVPAFQSPPLIAPELVTRGEFVYAVNDAYNIYSVLGTVEGFTDLEVGTPDYYEFMAAKAAGYITGYEDCSSGSENAVTRAEAAVLINNLLKLPTPEVSYEFSDQADNPSWAEASIQAVVAAGIMPIVESRAFRALEYLNETELDNLIMAAVKKFPDNRADKITKIKSFDGYELTGRLSMPTIAGDVDKVVILVHGTGPNTYLMNRQNDEAGFRLNVADFFADEFTTDGTAFYSYNTRGVTLGKGAFPLAPDAVIDEESYRTYTPQNSAHDMEYIIEALKKEPRLKNAEFYLFGTSEGTVISSYAVTEYEADADALIHLGYCNDNMKDVLEYQLNGGMSYFNFTTYFNAVGQDSITREQYEADPYGYAAALAAEGAIFDTYDFNLDGLLSFEDFNIYMNPIKEGLFAAVEAGDDQWIADNMVATGMMPPLVVDWFQAHFELPKTEDTMTEIDIPVYIFQGSYDANCPVQGVYDVQARFEALHKDNLEVNIYEGYDHSLNINSWLFGMGSEGYEDIVDLVESF